MSTNLATEKVAGLNTPIQKSCIGQMVTSIIPLHNDNLHLLDGSLLDGNTETYEAFYNFVLNSNLYIDETTYQNDITNYGICGRFAINTTNKTVRLPKVLGIVEYTINNNNLGRITEAGVPNMYGTVSFRRQRNDGNMNVDTGAFHDEGLDGGHNFSYYDTSSTSQYNNVSFDASRSSSIYGNNTTVQPQTIKTFNYIVIK